MPLNSAEGAGEEAAAVVVLAEQAQRAGRLSRLHRCAAGVREQAAVTGSGWWHWPARPGRRAWAEVGGAGRRAGRRRGCAGRAAAA